MSSKAVIRQTIRDSTTTYQNNHLPFEESKHLFDIWNDLPTVMNNNFIIHSFRVFSHKLFYGDLRRINPTKFKPCTNPFLDDLDDEQTLLQTVVSRSGTVYKLPIPLNVIGKALIEAEFFPIQMSFLTATAGIRVLSEDHLVRDMLDQAFKKDFCDLKEHLATLDGQPYLKRLKIRSCAYCDTESTICRACENCRLSYYCNVACQSHHWELHKLTCHRTSGF
jgi:hypothetical protein